MAENMVLASLFCDKLQCCLQDTWMIHTSSVETLCFSSVVFYMSIKSMASVGVHWVGIPCMEFQNGCGLKNVMRANIQKVMNNK